MKKILILIFSFALLTGCTKINDSSYEELIQEVVTTKVEVANTFRSGYKFYLPRGLYVRNSKEYNEVIKNDSNTYYLYIDLISYLNGENVVRDESKDATYYKTIDNGEISGYVEIKLTTNSKYLVEIAYNYAKIEVVVEENYLRRAVTESMIILASIQYNESFLKNLSDESLLTYKEENVDIFNKENDGDNGNFLKYQGEYDAVDENKIPDYDLIQ